MPNRRMFSLKIINSARFLKMPIDSQVLYFHLGLRADDDGIVEAYPVMKMLGTSEDNLKVLAAKQFVKVLNEDLVSFITDWLEHNYIRADRKVDSIYKNLLLQMLPDFESIEPKTRADTEQFTGQPNTRVSKDKISKDKISKDSINNIFNYWNTKKIVTHIKLTSAIRTKINTTLKEYSEVNIKKSIDNYKKALDDKKYFWDYRWELKDFLQRGLEKFLSVPLNNFLIQKENTVKKPYYRDMRIIEKGRKKFCIPNDGGEWLEFCGKKSEIEWK